MRQGDPVWALARRLDHAFEHPLDHGGVEIFGGDVELADRERHRIPDAANDVKDRELRPVVCQAQCRVAHDDCAALADVRDRRRRRAPFTAVIIGGFAERNGLNVGRRSSRTSSKPGRERAVANAHAK
ncbi:hypothetical protein GCM10011490_23180 [Pseudoclavibacter endophyticus]|nr:hypothetical protein GCM10011490_23180 [Pseudoclavibacter endophyticus]